MPITTLYCLSEHHNVTAFCPLNKKSRHPSKFFFWGKKWCQEKKVFSICKQQQQDFLNVYICRTGEWRLFLSDSKWTYEYVNLWNWSVTKWYRCTSFCALWRCCYSNDSLIFRGVITLIKTFFFFKHSQRVHAPPKILQIRAMRSSV